MKAILSLTICFITFTVAIAQEPTGKEILERIDSNLSSENRVFTSQMTIHGRRGSRTVQSKSWAQGEDKAFTKYLAPAREKGTKMLKLEDNLWMYSPSADRTIQISGHMLRQSVMGSDLSYEDMMEDRQLSQHYRAQIAGTDTVLSRPCWILDLTAQKDDLAYHKRRLWVDRERYIPLKQELYAKSGRLLKRMELRNVVRLQNRWFPKRIIFKDMLKKGKGTEFIFQDIRFNQTIPNHIFSKAVLRK